MVYEVEATLSQFVGLEPHKTLNWQFILYSSFPFVQYTRIGLSY